MKKTLLSIFAIAALAISASAQLYIPNSGMETWASSVGEDQQPTGWVSYNVFTAPILDPSNTNPTSVTQAPSPNNYQGTYSAKIVTIDLVTNPSSTTIPNRGGFLMAGSISFVSPYLYSGYQFTSRPTTFSYAAKYTPSGVDTAMCLVALTHWNGTSRDTVAAAFDYLPVAIGSYQVRTVNLIYNVALNNTFPDTAIIYFSASSLIAPQAGSALWVDALSLSGYNGVNENSLSAGVDVYPNPSSTITNFDVVSADAYEVVIYDMTGREVNRTAIHNKTAQVPSYDMTQGIYTYSIVTKENNVLSRGKFAVAQ
ncbi:MAG TPA: T9SS type A sorting domain-containing protein [Bacteroidia bacterium]|nr:T9SS type A sorting domain-containing protein [Bacteroidia bacterium]